MTIGVRVQAGVCDGRARAVATQALEAGAVVTIDDATGVKVVAGDEGRVPVGGARCGRGAPSPAEP